VLEEGVEVGAEGPAPAPDEDPGDDDDELPLPQEKIAAKVTIKTIRNANSNRAFFCTGLPSQSIRSGVLIDHWNR
jgi:hypothetical protein